MNQKIPKLRVEGPIPFTRSNPLIPLQPFETCAD